MLPPPGHTRRLAGWTKNIEVSPQVTKLGGHSIAVRRRVSLTLENLMKNPVKSVIAFALMFAAGVAFASDGAKKEAAPAEAKVAGCCAKAAKDGGACGHGCCVEAAKAGDNCAKCGGSGKVAKKAEAKK